MTDRKRKAYGWRIAIIFMLAWGTAFWDRLTISQTSEVIMQALQLNTLQFSTLTALSTVAYSISSILVGIWSDKIGKRKPILVPFVIANGILSLCCGLCSSYGVLLALRIAVGIMQGPMLTIMMAIMAVDSFPGTFGRNAGITAAGVSIVANTLGPVITTRLATAFSWNTSFFVSGSLLIVLALLVIFFVREPKIEPGNAGNTLKAFAGLFSYKTVRLCLLIGFCCLIGYWTTALFAPIYLTEVMGLSTGDRGMVSSVMGFIFIFTQLLIPGMSDRIGRRPALFIAFAFGMLSPLGMWLLPGTKISIVGYCVCGGLVATTTSLFGNVVLMESLPEDRKASAGGVVMGISEIIGGTIWPLLASGVADALGGIGGIMMITAMLFVGAAVFSLMLDETNPAVLARKNNR